MRGGGEGAVRAAWSLEREGELPDAGVQLLCPARGAWGAKPSSYPGPKGGGSRRAGAAERVSQCHTGDGGAGAHAAAAGPPCVRGIREAAACPPASAPRPPRERARRRRRVDHDAALRAVVTARSGSQTDASRGLYCNRMSQYTAAHVQRVQRLYRHALKVRHARMRPCLLRGRGCAGRPLWQWKAAAAAAAAGPALTC